MKHLLVRLILAFAFVASTVHAPAIAHEEPASHHADHGATFAHDATADHHGEEEPSHEGAGGNLHHHHCPTALDARENGLSFVVLDGKALIPLHRANPLTSFSQAPPTEPPAA